MDLNKEDAVKVTGEYRGKQQFEVGTLTLFDCQIIKEYKRKRAFPTPSLERSIPYSGGLYDIPW